MKKAPPEPRSLLWESYWDLHTMRGVSMGGAMPIPYDKIRWFALEELQLDPDEADAFIWMMRRVDNHFVAKINKRNEQSTK